MKSLIQKDLFNISHNAKPMVFMLIIFAFIIIFVWDLKTAVWKESGYLKAICHGYRRYMRDILI